MWTAILIVTQAPLGVMFESSKLPPCFESNENDRRTKNENKMDVRIVKIEFIRLNNHTAAIGIIAAADLS